ncbi:MAG TPA: FAD-dependent oxidoreductase [Candidatus Dormibacteraeota bacterium]|nr:FAD-dependent oxidoreductase [Candidatus Dormibacteraeota bacterium]
MRVDFLVVGAGPTGIGAAHNLEERGEKFLLVDSDSRPGGLAKSIVDSKGFTWDMGGHVQFSHYELFDTFMDRSLGSDGWLNHVRQSWIWVAGRFIPFPLQNNLHRLPDLERQACIEGLAHVARRNKSAKAVNLRMWIDQNFGDGIADLFMVPYNLKTWAHPLEQLGTYWVEDRVAIPSIYAVRKAAEAMSDDIDWGPNRTFRFPIRGGTGATWVALASQLGHERVRLGDGVVEINSGTHRARLASGLEVTYEHVVSTMPVDRLTLVAGLRELSSASAHLLHSTTHVVGIGLVGSTPLQLRGKNWMYFPESNCPFYRVTVFSNYSPNNVPSRDTWSLLAEVSESQFKPVDRGRVVEAVIGGLRATNLVAADCHVISTWHAVLPYGYPIPTVDRDEVLGEVLPALEELGIYSRGRFGAWKYEVGNQDHSFMQGWECVDRICTAAGPESEVTLASPSKVNSRLPSRTVQN